MLRVRATDQHLNMGAVCVRRKGDTEEFGDGGYIDPSGVSHSPIGRGSICYLLIKLTTMEY